MSRDVPPEITEVGHSVVLEIWRRYRTVDPNDLRQEVALWALSNPGKVKQYLALDEREMRAVVATSLRNRLRRYAEKDKALSAGYEHHDVFFYDEKQLRDLLVSVFDTTAWVCPPTPDRGGEGRGVSLPSERGGWVTLLADVAGAWRKLPQPDREIVRLRFEDDITQREIARRFEMTDGQVSDIVERAVRWMHQTLGGEKPAYEADEKIVGHRRALGNAAAQAITAEGWEG